MLHNKSTERGCGRSFAPYARTVVYLDATNAMLEVGRREAEKQRPEKSDIRQRICRGTAVS